jgi:riboflavin transporter FmnP
MFSLFRKAVNVRLLVISFSVYLFVNLFENLIHYNIGKHSNSELKFEIPTEGDWTKIVVVMLTFALIQGVLTCLIDDRCS